MSNLFQKIDKLKVMYPDDVEEIEKYTERVKEILKKKEFYETTGAKEIIIMCRKDILMAKKKLATDVSLVGKPEEQKELWFIIESRQWTLSVIAEDYDGQLKSIDSELTTELSR